MNPAGAKGWAQTQCLWERPGVTCRAGQRAQWLHRALFVSHNRSPLPSLRLKKMRCVHFIFGKYRKTEQKQNRPMILTSTNTILGIQVHFLPVFFSPPSFEQNCQPSVFFPFFKRKKKVSFIGLRERPFLLSTQHAVCVLRNLLTPLAGYLSWSSWGSQGCLRGRAGYALLGLDF